MDFGWTEEQRELRERVIAFAREELGGGALEDDRAGRFPAEKWKRCAGFGLLRCNIPEAYGGDGRDVLTRTTALSSLSAIRFWVRGTSPGRARSRCPTSTPPDSSKTVLASGRCSGSATVRRAASSLVRSSTPSRSRVWT